MGFSGCDSGLVSHSLLCVTLTPLHHFGVQQLPYQLAAACDTAITNLLRVTRVENMRLSYPFVSDTPAVRCCVVARLQHMQPVEVLLVLVETANCFECLFLLLHDVVVDARGVRQKSFVCTLQQTT